MEMMEEYTRELEDRLNNKDHNNVTTISDDALNLNLVNDNPSYSGPVDFTDRKMTVMTMRVDSASDESRGDWSLVETVREVATSVVDDVVVVEDAWSNSIIVAIQRQQLPSVGTPLAQLLAIASQVVTKVSHNHKAFLGEGQAR